MARAERTSAPLTRIFRMKHAPPVSIGLPVYNGDQYLEAALKSLLEQDYEDFELIISDNCSDDRTEAICRQYAEQDRRIRYHRNAVNEGAARNYNKVFELARGEFFKWATHDDICRPAFLRRCVETLRGAPPSTVLVYPLADFIDEEGRILRPDTDVLECRYDQAWRRLARVLPRLWMANAVFGLIRSETLRHTRLIDRFIASDFVLLAELAMLGQFWEIPEKLFLRRDHPGGSVQANPGNLAKLAWFDPITRPKRRLMHTHFPELIRHGRLTVEYLRSVGRLPLSPGQRLLCFVTVPAVIYGQPIRNVGGLWKRRVKDWLGINPAPVSST